MKAVKAVHNGKAFIPVTADGDSQQDVSRALFETPLTDSIIGILEGVETKTTDAIKDIRLAKYLK
jgi:hypothetical protein